jgi:hypothetical protein
MAHHVFSRYVVSTTIAAATEVVAVAIVVNLSSAPAAVEAGLALPFLQHGHLSHPLLPAMAMLVSIILHQYHQQLQEQLCSADFSADCAVIIYALEKLPVMKIATENRYFCLLSVLFFSESSTFNAAVVVKPFFR